MDVTSHCWYLQIFLLLYVVSGKRRPSANSRFQGEGESCTFSDGQFCRDHLAGTGETEPSDRWQLLFSAELLTQEYYAGISCRRLCEEKLTVLRNLEGSTKSLYLSFYYNIWKFSNTSNNPPSLSIVSCGGKPNWVSNAALYDYSSSTWRGAVMSLHCEDTFNISFVAHLSSPDHVIAVDNIALTYGFSTKGILSRPSFNITSPLGTTDNPVTSVKMSPFTHSTSVTPVSITSATMNLLITDKSRKDEVPFRTFAMSGTYGVNLDDHAAFTPVMIMTFVAIICTTTIVIHILICKNQRRISSRLRRISTTVLPPQREQRKSSPDVFVTSYSSSHVTEPRSVSFVSQNDKEFHAEDIKPSSQGQAKRRVSVGCVEDVSKPSLLRPHGRAYTTPVKPKDALYESIDGTSLTPGLESGPKRFLRKLSPSRLPRLLDNKRFSLSDLQKKDKPGSNSSSVLSVTVDQNAQNLDKLNSQRLTPPLPPRTYTGENGSHAIKSKSSPQLIGKKTVTLPRVVENLSKHESRRWSEVPNKYNCEQIEGDSPKTECEYHVLESGSPESITDLQEHAKETLRHTDLPSTDHRYYILESGSMRDPKTELNESVSMAVGEGPGSNSDPGYHVLENSASLPLTSSCSFENSHCDDISSASESNAYQSIRGSLGSHHTYQSLDHQNSLDCAFDKVPSFDEMDQLQSEVPVIQANFHPKNVEIASASKRYSKKDNNGYSFPFKRKENCSDHQGDRTIDKKSPQEGENGPSSFKESFAADSIGSLSVSSDHSGYTQLQTQETNVPCCINDTESSGGYDHIKR